MILPGDMYLCCVQDNDDSSLLRRRHPWELYIRSNTYTYISVGQFDHAKQVALMSPLITTAGEITCRGMLECFQKLCFKCMGSNITRAYCERVGTQIQSSDKGGLRQHKRIVTQIVSMTVLFFPQNTSPHETML